MRRLCLGGSFNPIHYGHLICARFAAEQLGLSGVRLIPAAANPHKAQSADLASADDRLRWCQLAVAGDPFFTVDPIEIRRSGPSYTYDTARALVESGLESRVCWLIGTDLLTRLHTWHRFDELIQEVDFVVMQRAGETVHRDGLDPRVQKLADSMIRVPQIEISSTLIRERLRSGKPLAGLVPASVERALSIDTPYLT